VANHKSAKKRAKQSVRKLETNRSRKSEVRTAIKRVREAVAKEDKTLAGTLLVHAQSLLSKLAKSSALHKKTGARITSRLTAHVNKL